MLLATFAAHVFLWRSVGSVVPMQSDSPAMPSVGDWFIFLCEDSLSRYGYG
jgi:hypothetical protein